MVPPVSLEQVVCGGIVDVDRLRLLLAADRAAREYNENVGQRCSPFPYPDPVRFISILDDSAAGVTQDGVSVHHKKRPDGRFRTVVKPQCDLPYN
jgi:hypothetical protein